MISTFTSARPDMGLRLYSDAMLDLVDGLTLSSYDIVQVEGIEMAPYGLHIARNRNVNGAEEARLDIQTVRGASVTGAIIRYDPRTPPGVGSSDTSMVARGGVSGFLLELSDGSVRHRRFTGPHGRFEFTGVVPGRWTLRVIRGNVPDDHAFERDFFVLDVSAGSRGEVVLRLVPRKRTIKLLEQSELPQEPVEN